MVLLHAHGSSRYWEHSVHPAPPVLSKRSTHALHPAADRSDEVVQPWPPTALQLGLVVPLHWVGPAGPGAGVGGVGAGVGAGVGPLGEHCGVPDGFHEHPPTRVQCVWSVQLGQSDETQLSSQPPPLLSA